MGVKYRKFNGKAFHDRGWSRDKRWAENFANKLRARGNLVRVVEGKSSEGNAGYRIYSRKN